MIKLMHGDCLELMKDIPDNSVDMVLCDPPYGTTQNSWDTVIPFDKMWSELERIVKSKAAICLFAQQPFSSALVMSNPKIFKYEWIWEKSRATGHLNAKKVPMKSHENILVFAKSSHPYYPIMSKGKPYSGKTGRTGGNYGSAKRIEINNNGHRYPRTNVKFNNQDTNKQLHPTQKPTALLSYLIQTYTLERDVVFDFTMGSGSTGVAAKYLKRSFIGIEKDDKYFNLAKARIDKIK